MVMRGLVFVVRLYIVLALWLPAIVLYGIGAGVELLLRGLKPRGQQGSLPTVQVDMETRAEGEDAAHMRYTVR
jgi:hypothetical protein